MKKISNKKLKKRKQYDTKLNEKGIVLAPGISYTVSYKKLYADFGSFSFENEGIRQRLYCAPDKSAAQYNMMRTAA